MADEHYLHSPTKRRRISIPHNEFGNANDVSFNGISHPSKNVADQLGSGGDVCQTEGREVISIPASKHADEAVAPFLARHIPDQYAPMGPENASGKRKQQDPNTIYCYRHRPDLKCRRQPNEPSMEQLQNELQGVSQTDQQAISHVWSLYSAAPAKHRQMMLQGILAQCCFSQLSYLSANVRDLIRIDFLTALPTELSFKILCSLDTASLCKAAQVSQRWRSLADDDVVWHRMCEQHIDRKCEKCGWGLPLLERKLLRSKKREIQLRATGRGLNEWSPNITPAPETDHAFVRQDAEKASSLFADGNVTPSTLTVPTLKPQPTTPQAIEGDSYFQPRIRPWKDVYKDRFLIGSNWKYGRCSTKIFRGHTNGVMCLQFTDSILATGSYDSTIKIWDIESGAELRTLRGHTSGVRCLQFDDSKLISGSLDHTLRIWNWRTGELLATYTGHTDGIIGLHFDGTLLASGSADHTIKIWNFGAGKSTHFLRGHTDWVNAVRVDSASRTVLSASDDCTVKLWDLDSKTCIRTFEGHVGQVQQVVVMPPEFTFDSSDEEILHGGGADDTDGTASTISSSSQQRPATPPTATAANTAIDDPPSCPYGPTFRTPQQPDRPLPPHYILTGALDSTIRLWSTTTGKCLRTYFGHVEGIWALAADTLRIVSGGEDRMVKVWDTRSNSCSKTFTGHAGPVTCIGLSERRVGSGGEDGEVRVCSF